MKRNTFIIQELKASATTTFFTQQRRGGGRVKRQARQDPTLPLVQGQSTQLCLPLVTNIPLENKPLQSSSTPLLSSSVKAVLTDRD